MRAVGRRGDGSLPCPETRSGVSPNHLIKEVSPAAGGPRFADQSTIPEAAFIGAETIKDLVNDLHGYVNLAPTNLGRTDSFSNGESCRNRRNLTIESPGVSIGVGDRCRRLVFVLRAMWVLLRCDHW